MFILGPVSNTSNGNETINSKQLATKKHNYHADVSVADDGKNAPSTPQPVKLNSLLKGLIKQKHWIYFLNQDIQLRAEGLPVLQVKLKEHHIQSECIARIVMSGHCSAVIVEANQMDEVQLQHVQALCIKQQVQLIFLESLKDNGKLH